MLFLNLLSQSKKKSLVEEVRDISEQGRAELRAVWIGVLGILVVVVAAWFGKDTLYLLRLSAIAPERRQMVLDVCDSLEQNWPEDDNSLSEFRAMFDGLEIYTDEYTSSPSVEFEPGRLVLGRQFFALDHARQAEIFTKFLRGAEELPGLPPLDEL